MDLLQQHTMQQKMKIQRPPLRMTSPMLFHPYSLNLTHKSPRAKSQPQTQPTLVIQSSTSPPKPIDQNYANPCGLIRSVVCKTATMLTLPAAQIPHADPDGSQTASTGTQSGPSVCLTGRVPQTRFKGILATWETIRRGLAPPLRTSGWPPRISDSKQTLPKQSWHYTKQSQRLP